MSDSISSALKRPSMRRSANRASSVSFMIFPLGKSSILAEPEDGLPLELRGKVTLYEGTDAAGNARVETSPPVVLQQVVG